MFLFFFSFNKPPNHVYTFTVLKEYILPGNSCTVHITVITLGLSLPLPLELKRWQWGPPLNTDFSTGPDPAPELYKLSRHPSGLQGTSDLGSTPKKCIPLGKWTGRRPAQPQSQGSYRAYKMLSFKGPQGGLPCSLQV